jgi:hypothetical protein
MSCGNIIRAKTRIRILILIIRAVNLERSNSFRGGRIATSCSSALVGREEVRWHKRRKQRKQFSGPKREGRVKVSRQSKRGRITTGRVLGKVFTWCEVSLHPLDIIIDRFAGLQRVFNVAVQRVFSVAAHLEQYVEIARYVHASQITITHKLGMASLLTDTSSTISALVETRLAARMSASFSTQQRVCSKALQRGGLVEGLGIHRRTSRNTARHEAIEQH